MRHEIAPHLAAGVGQPKVEQQARCFHAAGAQEHARATLAQFASILLIDHRADHATGVTLDIDDPAIGSQLGTVRAGQRQPGGIDTRLGAVAATLMTGAAVVAGRAHAVVRLLMRPGHQCGRRIGGGDAQRAATALHRVGRCIALRRRIGVAALGIPRIVRRPGHADELLDAAEIGQQLFMRDRPVHAALPGLRRQAQVALVRTRAEGAPMQGGTTQARPGVVGAKCGWRLPAAEALFHPVDAGRQLIGQMGRRAEGRTRLQHHHRKTSLREPCSQWAAPCPASYHHHIDCSVVDARAHRSPLAGSCQPSC